MKTLIIHHLEPMWEEGYKNNSTSFNQLLELFNEHLEDNQYDRIILTRFEDFQVEPEIYGYFADLVDKVYSYGYAWCRDMFDDEDILEQIDEGGIVKTDCGDYVEGGSHSELVLIDDWMYDLRGQEIYISGAFDGECIEDLEIALGALEIPFKRVSELIV